MSEIIDCLVVGGGPGGLAAATYLARYRRGALVVDGGTSRCALIPTSHNCPGWPDGIHGPDLLANQREQARRYGARLVHAEIDRLDLDDGLFRCCIAGQPLLARHVVLATGAVDIEPDLPDVPGAIRRGLLRHCPICDAYEVIDRRVAVLGYGDKGLNEAMFLRHYTADVTLLTLGRTTGLGDEARRRASACGIRIVDEPVARVILDGERIGALQLSGGVEHGFDSLYSALGTRNRAELAVGLGAERDAEGALKTDAHQQTSIPRLYAIGDVVSALNQIAVAWAHAATATTHVHNCLRDADGYRLA